MGLEEQEARRGAGNVGNSFTEVMVGNLNSECKEDQE